MPERFPNETSSHADELLHAASGGDALEPGSRTLRIKLEQHTPLEALAALTNSQPRMSVALHEITHFASLENTLGHTLGFVGLLTAMSAQQITETLDTSGQVSDGALRFFITLEHDYRCRLDAARPLLEGIAMFVQTSKPHTAGDTLISPLATLASVAGTVTALDPGTDALASERIHERIDWLLAAGQATMRDGSCSPVRVVPLVPERYVPLAYALETSAGDRLPYFLGHTYVRALHDRLRRRSTEYESPESFVELVLRLLYSSSARLLEGIEDWTRPNAVERLYNWIDIVERAPRDRVQALTKLEEVTDVLWFLETGEVRAGVDPNSNGLGGTLARVAPGVWRTYAASMNREAFRDIAAAHGDVLEPSFDDLAAHKAAAGWVIGTNSLNVSSGGKCEVCGFIPRRFGERHAVALRVGGALWWLTLDERELRELPGDVAALRRLPPGCFPFGAVPAAASTIPLKIACFVTRSAFGVRAAPPGLHQCLFELSCDQDADWSLLLVDRASDHRAILEPAPTATAQLLHGSVQQMRAWVRDSKSRSLAAVLKKLASSDGGSGQAAALKRILSERELESSRQRQLWSRRILQSLLGARLSPSVVNILQERGLGALLPELSTFEGLIADCYGVPAKFDETLAQSLQCLNDAAHFKIGRPLFAYDASRCMVVYQGLWSASETTTHPKELSTHGR